MNQINNSKKIYHAAIYVRLSKEDGDVATAGKRESNSISNQKNLIKNFLKDKKDIVVVSERVDDGYSGSNFERPAFQMMLEDIKKGIVDCVVVKDLSRFGREYIDAGKYIERLFPALGVRFIAVNDHYDSLEGKSQADEIVIPFKNLINDAYCRDISIKIRSHLEVKRKNGEYIGAFTPYGYQKDSDNKNKLVIDVYAADIVKEIYRMKLSGMSQTAIANALNKQGVLSPMEYKHSLGIRIQDNFKTHEQAEWSAMSVKRILENEVYTGTLVQGKRTTPNHKVKKLMKKPETDWVRIEKNHEAILSEREFALVQRLLGMLEHTDKGRTKQTIRNCVTVLQNDPVLKKAIKRNELSGRMDIVKEVPWERRNNTPTVTDTDEYNLKMYLEEHYEITSERVIKAGIDIVSNENKYHPIRDYLESLVWDGIPRIENMLPHFLGAEKSKYTIGVMKMHMLAAISRIYEPGIKYDIMLCLVGSQGAGKSTFFKYLAIKEEWFSDNLDHLDDENIYRKLQNHWIIEMGEMKATITAKNIEQIKSFLSRQKETYKVPYEVHPEDRPRQCVFCGTSNDLNFLPLDRTGNRRFAPVMTDMSKAEVHILDNEAESKAYIEQAWAEAMVLYRRGNVFLGFTKEIEEEAKRLQKEFMPEDTNAGIIQAFLDDYDDEYVCTRILFDEALHRTGEMKQWEGKEIANIMNNAIEGWKPHGTHRFGKEYGIQRSWKRIEESVKKDKDGFMKVPEQLEIPFE